MFLKICPLSIPSLIFVAPHIHNKFLHLKIKKLQIWKTCNISFSKFFKKFRSTWNEVPHWYHSMLKVEDSSCFEPPDWVQIWVTSIMQFVANLRKYATFKVNASCKVDSCFENDLDFVASKMECVCQRPQIPQDCIYMIPTLAKKTWGTLFKASKDNLIVILMTKKILVQKQSHDT